MINFTNGGNNMISSNSPQNTNSLANPSSISPSASFTPSEGYFILPDNLEEVNRINQVRDIEYQQQQNNITRLSNESTSDYIKRQWSNGNKTPYYDNVIESCTKPLVVGCGSLFGLVATATAVGGLAIVGGPVGLFFGTLLAYPAGIIGIGIGVVVGAGIGYAVGNTVVGAMKLGSFLAEKTKPVVSAAKKAVVSVLSGVKNFFGNLFCKRKTAQNSIEESVVVDIANSGRISTAVINDKLNGDVRIVANQIVKPTAVSNVIEPAEQENISYKKYHLRVNIDNSPVEQALLRRSSVS